MNIKLLCTLLLLLILSACSPHPSSGGWQATSTNTKFQRLEIRYGGNADFYIGENDKIAAWRCFWGAADKNTASLKCIDAGNSNNERTYLFIVDTVTKEGVLKLDEKIFGAYVWQPPTDSQQE